MRKHILAPVILQSLLSFVIYTSAQNNLVLYWSFDELQDNIFYDISGKGNFGTTYGPVSIPGVKGKALSFDGTDDYAASPHKSAFPPGILSELGKGTISLWFKVDHIPEFDGIAPIFYYGTEEKCEFFDAANQGLIIEVGHSPVHYQSKRLYFTIWRNGCTFPSFCFDSRIAIKEGEWYHFVAVVGEDFNTGYLNGEEMTDRYYNFGTSSYSQFFEDAVVHEKLWLGRGYWDEIPQFFKGAIDELRIYGNPISDSDVLKLYEEVAEPLSVENSSPLEPDIRIFPNPSGDVVNIQWDRSDDFHHLKIRDLSGKIVLQENEPLNALNIGHLPEGVYQLQLRFSNFTREKFLVVQ